MKSQWQIEQWGLLARTVLTPKQNHSGLASSNFQVALIAGVFSNLMFI
jgi:hypothetical protein